MTLGFFPHSVNDPQFFLRVKQNLIVPGVIADQPPAQNAFGMFYYATDTNQLFRSNGTSWVPISSSGGQQIIIGLASNLPTASPSNSGRFYYETDTIFSSKATDRPGLRSTSRRLGRCCQGRACRAEATSAPM